MQYAMGVTEARGKLGELVDQVRYRGETIVLMKSGKPAAVLAPYALLERLNQEREQLFAVVDEVQAKNHDLALSDAELMSFVNEVVHRVRAQAE